MNNEERSTAVTKYCALCQKKLSFESFWSNDGGVAFCSQECLLAAFKPVTMYFEDTGTKTYPHPADLTRLLSEKDAEIHQLQVKLVWQVGQNESLTRIIDGLNKEIQQLKEEVEKHQQSTVENCQLRREVENYGKIVANYINALEKLKAESQSATLQQIEDAINHMGNEAEQHLNPLSSKQVKAFWYDWNETKSEYLSQFRGKEEEKPRPHQ